MGLEYFKSKQGLGQGNKQNNEWLSFDLFFAERLGNTKHKQQIL